MKIGFAGVGNMAQAIINGLLEQPESAYSLYGFAPSGPKSPTSKWQRVQWLASNFELAQTVDLLVLAVKPHMIKTVLGELQDVPKLPLLVSLAAGTTTATIRDCCRDDQLNGIARVMPNTPSAVGAGMSGLFATEQTNAEGKQAIETIFQSVGSTLWLADEDQFHALTAISGSGPAYYFMFTAALIEAGQAAGLSQAQAHQLAIATAHGAGQLMQQSDVDPKTLQQQVTSPNGTTHAATTSLAANQLTDIITQAVEAARLRSIELSNN